MANQQYIHKVTVISGDFSEISEKMLLQISQISISSFRLWILGSLNRCSSYRTVLIKSSSAAPQNSLISYGNDR